MSSNVFYRTNRSYPVAIRADGPYLWDQDGKRYLDGCSGALVANIGQGREEVAQAMADQARTLAFVHGSQFSSPALEGYAARLAAFAGLPEFRFWAVSGGSEATESAVKLARQYQVERGQATRFKIVTRVPSYHGATLGSLAASGMGARRELYQPLFEASAWPKIPRPDRGMAGPDDAERLRNLLEREGPETVAAFMAEPVVGASDAALEPSSGYHQRVREICDEYGVLFIADEVMCGMGRCGASIAINLSQNATPDIVVLGKGLSAGYAPLAGLLVSADVHGAVMDGSGAFKHGFTYAGHPVSVAAGSAVLDILEREGLVERARHMGARLLGDLQGLQQHYPAILEVRGRGLLLGLKLGDPLTGTSYERPGLAERLREAAMDLGLIVYPGSGAEDGVRGDHLLLGPALNLSADQATEFMTLLEQAFKQVFAGAGVSRQTSVTSKPPQAEPENINTGDPL